MFNAVVFSLLIWEISYSAGNFLIISLLQFPLELSIFLKFLLSSSFTLLLSFYLSKSYMLKKTIFKSSKKLLEVIFVWPIFDSCFTFTVRYFNQNSTFPVHSQVWTAIFKYSCKGIVVWTAKVRCEVSKIIMKLF